MSTVVACTFLGFASGVGVGFGVAVVVHFWWSVVDSVSRFSFSSSNRLTSGLSTHDPRLRQASGTKTHTKRVVPIEIGTLCMVAMKAVLALTSTSRKTQGINI